MPSSRVRFFSRERGEGTLLSSNLASEGRATRRLESCGGHAWRHAVTEQGWSLPPAEPVRCGLCGGRGDGSIKLGSDAVYCGGRVEASAMGHATSIAISHEDYVRYADIGREDAHGQGMLGSIWTSMAMRMHVVRSGQQWHTAVPGTRLRTAVVHTCAARIAACSSQYCSE